MATTIEESRECPYCKEEINPEAIKCKHCHSEIAPEKPDHEGTCPYCKEEIKADAIKCKHCQSSLLDNPSSECGCGKGSQTPGDEVVAFRPLLPGMGFSRGTAFAPAGSRCCCHIDDVFVYERGRGLVVKKVYACMSCAHGNTCKCDSNGPYCE